MRWMKGKGNKSKQKQQAASQQYICQYKIQYIILSTFTNKESIAHKDSLIISWKKFKHLPQLFGGDY